MGMVVPRPAIRAKESRVIVARLRRHDELTKQWIAEGMDPKEASRKAEGQVRREIPYKK